MRAGFLEIDGYRVRYLYQGSGPPILMLHGVGLSADIFVRNIGQLGHRFTVFAIDLPGHGFSDAIEFGRDAPQRYIARHVFRTADVLGIQKFSVLGHSYGGLVAALMYFEVPGRVENLIIVGSGSTFHSAEDQVKTLRAAAENGSRAMRDPTLDSCRRRLANICFDPAAVPEEILPIQLTSYALPDRLAAYTATIEGTIRHLKPDSERVFHRLEELTVNTLVITGRDDIRASVVAHEEGCRRMPEAELVVLERCGHLPFVERAEAFNDVVSRFMTRERKPRPMRDVEGVRNGPQT